MRWLLGPLLAAMLAQSFAANENGMIVRVAKMEPAEIRDLKMARASLDSAKKHLDEVQAAIARSHDMSVVGSIVRSGCGGDCVSQQAVHQTLEFDGDFVVLRQRDETAFNIWR